MSSQLLNKPEIKIADFYASPNEVSPEAFKQASNLLENELQSKSDSLSDVVFLAGIKAASIELDIKAEDDLESIITAAKNAGFEVEVTPVEMK